MLRTFLARKSLRLRSARARRLIHGYDTTPSNPLPILTHLPPSSAEASRPFPLYHPPPPSTDYLPLNEDTLKSLPSEERIQRELKSRLTKKTVEHLPELTEDDLRTFYSDLVKTGISDDQNQHLRIAAPGEERLRLPVTREEREEVMLDLETRLLGSKPPQAPSTSLEEESRGISRDLYSEGAPRRYRIFQALAQVAVPDEGPSGTSKSPAGPSAISGSGVDIPLGLVSKREWNVLFDEFIQNGDARGAEALLDVMTLHGVPVEQSNIDRIISVDAAAGRVEEVGRLTNELVHSGLRVNDEHKDLFILSLLRQNPSQPQNAISQLTTAEVAGQPYPQSSYQVVLQHLTQASPIFQPTSHTRALAWDLFTNMRLVAHPIPNRELYTTMIKTCGEANQPEPERARDLWIEMTESEKIQPTRDEYSAIIRALGSTKKDYLEAFDLLRHMLAKHHDVTYTPFLDDHEDLPKFSEYVPTLETFVGLLEGTKRAGDLNRARWILTETVKLARTGQMLDSPEWKDGINADLLSGVFMSYASWKPLVRRGVVKIKDVQSSEATKMAVDIKDGAAEAGQIDAASDEDWLDINVMEELVEPSSSGGSQALDSPSGAEADLPLTPQSSADALREATALFQRTLHDLTPSAHPNELEKDYLPFKNIVLGPKLVNSYISVHLAHSPSLASTKEVYEKAWSDVAALTKAGVGPRCRPNGWTYMQILEKCAHGTRSGMTDSDRSIAFQWGKSIWQEYLEWSENVSRDLERITSSTAISVVDRKKWLMGLGDRQVERIWKSAIKLYALHGDPSQSLEILEKFYETYTPEEVVKSYKPLPEIRGFKIRSTTNSSIPEANVPPYLLFDDVKLLHQKLVKAEKGREVGKLTFIVKRYEAMLAKRRSWRYKGVGQNREVNKAKYLEREKRRLGRANQEQVGRVGDGQDERLLSENVDEVE
ncbi:uncharacterized protein I303_107720 [Kwoniella dejecticola CBS 10117]|uniref:Pentatricopeptide repeat domain-containing protein n=1 Tax=Kwoniella dejecticola CBS 10117 TaxID=1296121 RepID=A0A1A5ZVI1_9TREE|nr:uncharacterized protein I303_07725 [Kwoniella dejecticola CBS 10117]OBR81815.1 hypothetical protein I303_07725 [Kwoniella dejecticola CBS 10117]